ncbi:Snf7-domain-containing protein [Paraphysoderma sedebokerense]|nr:Snf7-domain-containing protein [Paraphysoderma sedebokerense]KAI9139967.1 Snf7-domain-containing protein [Paraphysoderma sedebokerense]
MGNVFNKSANKVTSHDKAILELKIQRDKLKQYQKKLEQVQQRETEIAKKHLSNGDKKRALLALKKKKYQQTLIEKTDAQLFNLEELTNSIEYALVEKQVFEGLQKGNEVLKEIHNEMSIEKVEKLMQDTADAIEYQNEIENILNGQITTEDEESILKELEDIEKEELAKVADSMPDVPTQELPTGTKAADGKEPIASTKEPTAAKEKQKEKVKQKEPALVAS